METISKQRKIAGDVRDTILLDIFILSLDILKQALNEQIKIANDITVRYN